MGPNRQRPNQSLNLVNVEGRPLYKKTAPIIQKQGEVSTGRRMCLREKYGGVMQRHGRTLQAFYRKIERQNLLKGVARRESDKNSACTVPAIRAADVYGVSQTIGFSRVQLHKRGHFLIPANAVAPVSLAFPGQEESVVPGESIAPAGELDRTFRTA